jgi:hypothetical protein
VSGLAALTLILLEVTSEIRRDAFPTHTTNTVALPTAPDAKGKITQGTIRASKQKPLSSTTPDLVFKTSGGTYIVRIEIPSGAILSKEIIETRD